MPTVNRLRRGLASLGCLALLMASGCSAFRDDSSSAAEAPVSTTSTIPRPSTELLSAGDTPRRTLRFDLGSEEVTLALTGDIDVTQSGSGEPLLVDLPPIRQRIKVTTTPLGGGTTKIDVVFEALSAAPTPTLSASERKTLDNMLATLVGLRGGGRIDDRGRITAMHYTPPDDLNDDLASVVEEMTAQISSLVAPLPAEPVGLGARWRSTTNVEVGGAAVPISTVFEITSIDGDTISYTSTSEGRARNLALKAPRTDPDTRLHLVDLRSTGRGSGTFSLTSLRSTSDTRSETTQRTEATGPDGTASADQRTVAHVTTGPVR
ncbi:MAG: hypothetical protein KDB02_08350 [Acidimicrobiales bacterium]|nr:hypothetical protein [Acidimicrobiales bacterium]